MELPEQDEVEPFTACLSGLPADPERFCKPVRGLVEFAGHSVDEGDNEEARRQDVLIANRRGERLRLVRALQSLFELVGPEEAQTDLPVSSSSNLCLYCSTDVSTALSLISPYHTLVSYIK